MQLSGCQTWYRRVAIVLCQQGTRGWRYQRLTSTYGVSIGSESEGSQEKQRGSGKGNRRWGGCDVDLEVEEEDGGYIWRVADSWCCRGDVAQDV